MSGAVVVIFVQCQVVSAEVLVWAEIPGSGRREFLPLLPSDIVAIIIWIVLYVHATGRQAFSYRKVDMGSLTCETDMGSLTCETVLVRAMHTKPRQAAASLQE